VYKKAHQMGQWGIESITNYTEISG